MNELRIEELLKRIKNSTPQIRLYLSNRCWDECSGGAVPKLYIPNGKYTKNNMIYLYCKKCFREDAVTRELTVKEYFLIKIL